MGLTQRQRECLDFIRTHVKEKGVTPLVDEIRIALGYANKGTVANLLDILVARGAITRNPKIRRGIKLVPAKYDHGSDCLCERCPARLAVYQQFVQALKVDAPLSIRNDRATNFRRLSDATRLALLGQAPGQNRPAQVG